MELNICHLYPDILNLYGDRGNIITMKRRLEDRGIKVNIDECSIGQPLNADKYDIFFIGGGQDFEQEVLLRDLSSGKAQDIRTAVEEEKTFLAICGGYQMLGEYYKTWDGVQLDFIGAIGVHTIGAKERMIGNYMFRTTPESGDTVVVGFENHSGKTYLSEQVAPLGPRAHAGHIVQNPFQLGRREISVNDKAGLFPDLVGQALRLERIAVFACAAALPYDGMAEPLAPLDDTLELNAHRYMQERLSHNG